MLIKDAEINDEIVDIRCQRRIVEVGRGLQPQAEVVIEARGGSVLPGLHDHHLHFFALVAALRSVQCGPPRVVDAAGLAQAFAVVPGDGWLRGVGYHEAVAGDLDHRQLEALVPGRPARLQHSSGKMWLLNTSACDLLQLEAHSQPGIERDPQGRITGRLFRLDTWLQEQLAQARVATFAEPRFSEQSDQTAAMLLSFGLTGFTDASFTNHSGSAADFDCLPQHVWLMGDASLHAGPLKIMLDEDRLPALEALVQQIRQAHQRGRTVAFHCVARVELLLALAGLQQAGVVPGDRIEHGAVIPADVFDTLRQLGVCVVTQPGFVAERGDRYLHDVPDHEHADLYRYQTLLAAGIPVAASSDAPYGPVNPWQIMRAATQRRTSTGQLLGSGDRVDEAEALRGYLAPVERPGSVARKLVPGAAADLCILPGHWRQQISQGDVDSTVAHTIIDGQLCYSNPDRISSVCSPS